MHILWTMSQLVLWAVVVGLGFLLLGTLRTLGLVQWRLDQLEATRPTRINRDGLKAGQKAPSFALTHVDGGICSLEDYAGMRVLLVFVQANCGPCHAVVPVLNHVHRTSELKVLAINSAQPSGSRDWATQVGAGFPVLVQERLEISKKYQVFATPFAFVIDENGLIISSGIISSRQQVRYLLDAAAEHVARTALAEEGNRGASRDMQTSRGEEAEQAMKAANG